MPAASSQKEKEPAGNQRKSTPLRVLDMFDRRWATCLRRGVGGTNTHWHLTRV